VAASVQQKRFDTRLFRYRRFAGPYSGISDDWNVNEKFLYHEGFPVGSRVRIADRASLDEFLTSWRYHHKLQPEQLSFADQVATVEEVGFYHGGDPVYRLMGVPGFRLEQCLQLADSGC
jgi:hypothetical protein